MKHYKLSYQSPNACFWRYWFFDFSLCGMLWFVRIMGLQLTCYYKTNFNKEFCICAAIICKDGYIVRGHRHGDCIRTMQNMKKEIRQPSSEAQGFITSRNRFVNRKEAAYLQNSAKIKSVWTNNIIKDILFSEDLY